MSDWQPIETAPKDGTLLILGSSKRDDEYGGYAMQGFWDRDPENDGGQCWRLSAYDMERATPTDWMPLPEPPTEKGFKEQ